MLLEAPPQQVGERRHLVADLARQFGRLVADELRRRTASFPWGDTLPLLRRADLLVGNLEFVLAADGRPWPGKVFHFRADPAAVASLEEAGFGLVSVANNHVLDYGVEAALASLATLDARGIRHAGAGPDLDAARRTAADAPDRGRPPRTPHRART